MFKDICFFVPLSKASPLGCSATSDSPYRIKEREVISGGDCRGKKYFCLLLLRLTKVKAPRLGRRNFDEILPFCVLQFLLN